MSRKLKDLERADPRQTSSLPFGVRAIAAYRDPTVTIGDSPTDEELMDLGDRPYITAVRWSPDGARLAISWSGDGDILFWDVEGEESAGFNPIAHDATAENGVNAISWSPNGERLAAASDRVRIWDTETGDLTGQSYYLGAQVTAVCWANPGNVILAGSETGFVHMARVGKDYDMAPLVPQNTNKILDICRAPGDELVFASASAGYEVFLWDAFFEKQGYPIGDHTPRDEDRGLVAHDLYTTSVAWLSDAQGLVSASGDYSIKVWDTTLNECTTHLSGNHRGAIRGLSLSSDGKLLASSSTDHTVRIWETRRWQQVAEIPQRAHIDNLACSAEFSPNRNSMWLAMPCDHDSGFRVLDLSILGDLICPNDGYDATDIYQIRAGADDVKDFKCPICGFVFPAESIRSRLNEA